MQPRIEVSDQITKGYHGTKLDAARGIIANGFARSAPDSGAFLGEGVYFFDGQVSQAKRWATEHKAKTGDAIAVIGSNIKFGRMLNLADKEQSDCLNWFACEYRLRTKMKVTLATIIDIAAEKLNAQVVKAVRIPKNPSQLMETTFSADVEIILAVRELSNILSKEIVWEGLAGYAR